MRVLAIGDIHGCLRQFDALLEAMAPGAADQLVTLGDYIDRGPDSLGVMERLLAVQQQCRLIPLLGNHEYMFLKARSDPEWHAAWIKNGGDVMLRSYGLKPDASLGMIPRAHVEFLEHVCRDSYEIETHFFVHANARPDLSLAHQPEHMLRWERFEQAAAHKSGKIMVCGHTPQSSGRPRNRGYAICIDTHVYATGTLTGVEINNGRVWQVDAEGIVSRSFLSDYLEKP